MESGPLSLHGLDRHVKWYVCSVLGSGKHLGGFLGIRENRNCHRGLGAGLCFSEHLGQGD